MAEYKDKDELLFASTGYYEADGTFVKYGDLEND